MNSSTTEKAQCKCRVSSDFEILINSPVFRSSNPDVVKLFAYLAKRKKYLAGDTMIKLGKDATKAFLLLDGEVSISTVHKGVDVIIQNLHPGAFFGELSLLAKFKWFFNATAKTDCEALIIDKESFDKVMEQHPEKRKRIVERLIQLRVERLTDQTEYMLDLIPEEILHQSTIKAPLIA